MASFTDIIPQFNPYIQQLPVEAMVAVGMEKQKRYDEGIQKIQSQIDNIAGLDVITDVDKAYLQSKLNELGNNLKTVAAGDFSNFQLVNAVGGMTSQIVKDPIIKNAISSTAFYREQEKRLQNDIQTGKSNPANEVHFRKRANAWLSSKTPGTVFNSYYKTPIDVWGKIKDIAKEVGIDEETVRQLYKTDINGNILFKDVIDPKTGKVIGKEPDWNPIMVEKTLKGKDAGKILKAFQTGLTPADYEQLAINGEYENGNLTPAQLKDKINIEYEEQDKFLRNKIELIKTALVQETQKNEKDDAKISSLNSQLEYFQDYFTKITASREKDLRSVDANPDAVRASLYTKNYLLTMSKTLSSADVDTKYTISPMFEVTMKQNEFNRQLQRDKISDWQWSQEQRRKDYEFGYQQQKDALDMFFKYGVKLPGLKLPPGTTGLGDPIKLPIDTSDQLGPKNQVEEGYSNSVNRLNDLNYDLTLQFFKAANPKKPGETDPAYDERLRRAIYTLSTKNKEDIETFTARFATKQLADWKVNPNQIPFEFRSLVLEQDRLSKDVAIQKGRMESVRQEAAKIAKERKIDVPSQEGIDKNIKPFQVNLGGGLKINLSKEDVVDFIYTAPQAWNLMGNTFTSKDQESISKQASARLKLKFGNNYAKIFDKLYAFDEVGGGIIPMGKDFVSSGSWLSRSNYTSLAKIESEIYREKGMIKQPLSAPILRGKENREDKNARISAVIRKYAGNYNETPGFNQENMQAALLSDDANAIAINTYPGATEYSPTRIELIITDSKAGKSRAMTIDAGDYEYLLGVRPPTNISIPKVAEQINYNGTSSLSGANDPSSTWFNASDFKNLKNVNYTLTGNLVPDRANPSLLWFKMYMHTPDGKTTPITYPEPIPMFNQDGSYNQQLDVIASGINHTLIQQLLKR